jgi:hypothetical protein
MVWYIQNLGKYIKILRGSRDAFIWKEKEHIKRSRQHLKETKQYQEKRIVDKGRMKKEWVLGTKKRPETSYAQAVLNEMQQGGKVSAPNEEKNKSKLTKIPPHEAKEEIWKGMKYTATYEDLTWAKKGFVGRVYNYDEVSTLQQKIMDVGILSIEIIPMGGDKVFIKVHDDEDFHSLVKDAREVFQHWFIKIEEWFPEVVMRERVTWVRLYGVPVHAWNSKFFEKLCLKT